MSELIGSLLIFNEYPDASISHDPIELFRNSFSNSHAHIHTPSVLWASSIRNEFRCLLQKEKWNRLVKRSTLNNLVYVHFLLASNFIFLHLSILIFIFSILFVSLFFFFIISIQPLFYFSLSLSSFQCSIILVQLWNAAKYDQRTCSLLLSVMIWIFLWTIYVDKISGWNIEMREAKCILQYSTFRVKILLYR